MYGASWAYEQVRSSKIFLSFWGICAAGEAAAQMDEQENLDYQCWPWADVCGPNSPSLGAFKDRACRTRDLQGFLGFCMIASFFSALFFFIVMVLRSARDSRGKKIASIVFGSFTCLLTVLAFGTYNDQCFPGEVNISMFGFTLGTQYHFKIGPAFAATIAAFCFMFLNLIAAALLPVNVITPRPVVESRPYEPKGQISTYV
jgi:hypothetical protein